MSRANDLVALGRRVQDLANDPSLTEEERLKKWQALLDEPDDALPIRVMEEEA